MAEEVEGERGCEGRAVVRGQRLEAAAHADAAALVEQAVVDLASCAEASVYALLVACVGWVCGLLLC